MCYGLVNIKIKTAHGIAHVNSPEINIIHDMSIFALSIAFIKFCDIARYAVLNDFINPLLFYIQFKF